MNAAKIIAVQGNNCAKNWCKWKYTYSVKTKSQVGNIWVKDFKTTQKGQRQRKIYAISWKIQQSALGPGESAVGVTYLSMRIHPESCHIFPLKVVATSVSGSREGTFEAW